MSVYRFRFYGTAVGNHSIVAIGGHNAAGAALDANEELTTSPVRAAASSNPTTTPNSTALTEV